MTEQKKLPIGIQDFESLRKDGYLYVDKTESVYKLISTGRYYFLSRPRRFGKSLLISTLKALFESKRDLFEGLAITKTDYDWTKRPVMHLDFVAGVYSKNSSELLYKLNHFISEQEAIYGCDDTVETSLPARFEGVIHRAHRQTGHRVAILIDEYDKPILESIGKPELQKEYISVLDGFYQAFKSMEDHIKFVLITGVTKFGKASVMNDTNYFTDISMDIRYYDICGIKEEDITTYFKDGMLALADTKGMTHKECMTAIRRRYDGYHFTEASPGIYNPWDILNTFRNQSIGSYWFETGTPSYLVYLLQRHDYNLEEMSRVEADSDVLNSTDAESTNPIPVIYQSGYLTIKGFDPEFKTYTLGFPNEEVEERFTKYLMPCYIYPKDRQSPFLIDNFVRDVERGRTNQFITRLKSLFADTPYELIKNLENHYQNVVWLLYKLIGFYTQAEYHTSDGRIDLVVKTPKYCYVMEFKLDGTAEEALAQISDKSYTLPFVLDGQQIVRIGMNFSKETRNIEKAVVG